tara:strand:- start:8786 stop:8974 length:189 start_codon:yes stop_codon:yes gene_type:complete
MDPISASYSIPAYLYPAKEPNMEYQQQVIRITNDTQYETIYTYDKNGNLISSVIRDHVISLV